VWWCSRSVMVPATQAAALERLADTAPLETPAPARRMLVIVNPYATTMSVRLKHLVVYALQGRFEVEAIDTQRKGHAIELCREAAGEGYDVVVAFGGDGTVNEAANGLAGSDTVLTLLPGGATNVYCRMLGIPTDVVDATEHLLALADRWRPRAVDLGRANDRWFTFAAGAGLDASVVERVDSHPRLKARFGPWYYAQAAIATFMERYVVNPPHVIAEAGGREMRGVSVFVQNAQPYTFFRRRPISLSDGASLQSGDLSGAVLTRASPLDVPTIGYRALSKRFGVGGHRRVHAFDHVDRLRVRSADERPVPLQVDGDYVGEHEEAVFSVLPGGLKVLR
jgi:diacylglycerol kinase family enzyme